METVTTGTVAMDTVTMVTNYTVVSEHSLIAFTHVQRS